jgi:type I restriction enzyme S subunit
MEKVYEKYKDSGLNWIGDVPEHWLVSEYKFVSQVQNGFAFKSAMFDKNVGFPILRIRDITSGNISTFYKGDYSDDYIVQKGDLLIGMDGDFNIRWWDKENILLNQRCCRIIENEKAVKRFLYYSLPFNLQIINDLTYFTTVKHLSSGDINNAKLPLPSPQEQTQIANYLDHKTGLIDAIIAQKEDLIKKLKEQRQAIINEAVTKGLNKDVKLKDSGIEWLGEIPEHWEVIKLFGLCYLVRGNSSFKKDELLSNGTYVALQYGKTYKVNEVNEKYKFYVNDEFYKESQIVNYGDTIIISTSETIEDLGHSVFYNRKDLGLLGGEQLLLKAKNNKINPKYLFYSTKVFLKDLRKNATGVKVYRFNIHDLKNVFTPVPSILEQNLIVKHIETKSTTIDKVIIRSQTSIQKLKEYRQSLISEAVTGKIDVRDWQATKS